MKNSKLCSSAIGILASTALAGSCALAGDTEKPKQCAEIESAEERLACYDAAAGAGEAVGTADDEFGSQKTKQEIEGDSLTSGVAGVDKDAYGKLIVSLENGQIWRQVESKRFMVKVGQVVEIRHGTLGSYKLYVLGGNYWTRVRREQ